jgi:site-specific DNA-adenine methylase
MINNIPSFAKWAGGKKQLIEQFKPFFPEKIER